MQNSMMQVAVQMLADTLKLEMVQSHMIAPINVICSTMAVQIGNGHLGYSIMLISVIL